MKYPLLILLLMGCDQKFSEIKKGDKLSNAEIVYEDAVSVVKKIRVDTCEYLMYSHPSGVAIVKHK